MLVIRCPDLRMNWRVLHQMVAIAEQLAQFSPQAKIKVYPPSDLGVPFEMRVDERSGLSGSLMDIRDIET